MWGTTPYRNRQIEEVLTVSHKFSAKDKNKLDNPERSIIMPPEATLEKLPLSHRIAEQELLNMPNKMVFRVIEKINIGNEFYGIVVVKQ